MPGYILHLTEAELIIHALKEEGWLLTDKWINDFRLGSLLPDTKRKKEKITSHFWNPADLEQQAIAPNLPIFLHKYADDLNSPMMLGYLAHLDLDACFVNSFWPSMWEFFDNEHHRQTLQKKIRLVVLKKSRKSIPVKDFFSSGYYYGDYSRMNAYLLDRYHLTVPYYKTITDFPVKEVQTEDLQDVLTELQHLCDTVQPGAEKQLAVFDLPSLESFIAETADQMASVLSEQYMNE